MFKPLAAVALSALFTAFTAESLTSTAAAADAAATKETVTPIAYVTAAAAGDLFEIQSSRLALQHASNADVRAFAQMMVDDHTRTTAEMTAAARQAGLNPPPPALSADHAQAMMQLQGMTSGAAFDDAYMKAQVLAHQQALDLHSGYASNGDQADLRALAAKTAPVIQRHLDRARVLERQVG